MASECLNCLNSDQNPSITLGPDGLCSVCRGFAQGFHPAKVAEELDYVRNFRSTGTGKWDCLVGLSGGKDSTATLYQAILLGLSPLAFTVNLGYYPVHIFERARLMAELFGVDHEIVDAREQITDEVSKSYRSTVALYEEEDADSERFRSIYLLNRRNYSIKHGGVMPYVRVCQLCRRSVIPTYYKLARKRGVKLVVLGMNEWTALSRTDNGTFLVSGIRSLRPARNLPSVTIAHLPFLLRSKLADVRELLETLGWEAPEGEKLVETSANSCLFAATTEERARELLGFHPDGPRLSREITAGFLDKETAAGALAYTHKVGARPRDILTAAHVL